MTRLRISASMFAAVLAVEFAIMIAFVLLPFPEIEGTQGAFFDAALLGVAVFVAYIALARLNGPAKPRNVVSNAFILVIVTVAFESQLHLVGQEFNATIGALGVDLLNSVMTAVVVGAVTAWLASVDARVASLDQPSIPLFQALGRSIVAGAVVAAACVASVPLLASEHAAYLSLASRSAWELSDTANRERAMANRLARLASAEATPSRFYLQSLQTAERQTVQLDSAWQSYVAHNRPTLEEIRQLPGGSHIVNARAHYLTLARRLGALEGAARAPVQRNLQAAVDRYAVAMERAADVVTAVERRKSELNDVRMLEWIAPIVVFALALGMLWPLLRLVAAQQSQLAAAFRAAQDLARRDPLTGLGNRRYLMEAFDAHASAPKARFAVLLLDLDRFKPINDVHGHPIGDQVLEIVAQRLRSVVRSNAAIARLGGDEFAIITECEEHADDIRVLSRRIVETLTAPISTSGRTLSIGASVGVSLYPKDAATAHDLLRLADAALYRAKENRGEAQFHQTGEGAKAPLKFNARETLAKAS